MNRGTCALERPRVTLEDERGVGCSQKSLKLEGELDGIEAGFELAQISRLASESLEERQPLEPLRDDRVVHRALPRADVNCGRREEAAAGKDAALNVGEESRAGGEQALDPLGCPQRRSQDLGDERLTCGFNRRELQIELGSEVGV